MAIEIQQKELASSLKTRAENLNVSLKEVSISTGLSVNTIKAVLDGKFCNTKSLLSVADSLGWSIVDVVNNSSLISVPTTVEETQIADEPKEEQEPEKIETKEEEINIEQTEESTLVEEKGEETNSPLEEAVDQMEAPEDDEEIL